ncbi:MAG: outer membrane protein assembly factor BamB family protein [Planctomycetota bacterium]
MKGSAYGKAMFAADNRTASTARQDLMWAPPVRNSSSDEWPTYRHDITRSGATSTDVPTDLMTKWTANFGDKLSGIVVAQNKLLVSAVDQQIIYCLNAANGNRLWKFFTAGPVDSPPTIYGSMAIFGCRNGYVYALRISDGELVWRFRAALADKRTVVRDRLESVWPVHGSVLVVNGTVYFAAGHTSYLDGGIRIYGLDVGSGKVKCFTKLSSEGASKDGAMTDVLVSDGQSITMRMRAYNLSLKETKQPRPATLAANTGLLEDCWGHRWNWNLGGGDTFGKLLVFDGEIAYGVQTYYTFLKHDKSMWPDTHSGHLHQKYSRYVPGQFPTGTRLFARLNRSKKSGTPQDRRQRRTLKSNSHEWNRKASIQYRAMVLADDVLFGAGWKDSEKIFAQEPHSKNDSVLVVMSPADGKVLGEYSLEAEPVFDSMAAAYGKLYLSLKDGSVVCYGGK